MKNEVLQQPGPFGVALVVGQGQAVQEKVARIAGQEHLLVLCRVAQHAFWVASGLHGFEDKIVISPVNPMEKQDHFVFVPPPEGSAALMIRKLLPKEARLCCAFNTIAANRWKALDAALRKLSDTPAGKAALEGIRMQGFVALDPAILAAARKAYATAEK